MVRERGRIGDRTNLPLVDVWCKLCRVVLGGDSKGNPFLAASTQTSDSFALGTTNKATRGESRTRLWNL